MEKQDLSKVYTSDLVEELSRREGVDTTVVEPHDKMNIEADGPATVLVVID